MKNDIFKIAIVSILILCNIFCLLLLIRERQIHDSKISILIDKVSEEKIISELINEDRFLAFQNEGYTISKKLEIINQNGDKIDFASYMSERQYLIFRYSFLNCQPCVDEVLRLLKMSMNEVDSSQILIFSNYQLLNDLKKFRRINKIFDEVYKVDSLNLPIDKLNIPYFFVLGKNMQVSHIFIPQKESPKTTERYLNMVKNKLQNQVD